MKNYLATLAARQDAMARRSFIIQLLKGGSAALLLNLPLVSKGIAFPGKALTIRNVMDMILKEIPGAPFKDTVDTIKSGSADNQLTGIVTTMFATVEVINQAIKLGANFIIAHEPSFFNHTDDVNWVGDNKVIRQKQELLRRNNITIWRLHDYWHAYRPDGILHGVSKKLGWENYQRESDPTLTIPEDSLQNIAFHVKEKLNISRLRVIGDLSNRCKKITLLPGAWGGNRQITIANQQQPDLLIVGEVHEWETAEYIRDARALGNDISLIILGHSVSEEPGMEWLAEWLKPKLPDFKITHVASNDPFIWI